MYFNVTNLLSNRAAVTLFHRVLYMQDRLLNFRTSKPQNIPLLPIIILISRKTRVKSLMALKTVKIRNRRCMYENKTSVLKFMKDIKLFFHATLLMRLPTI